MIVADPVADDQNARKNAACPQRSKSASRSPALTGAHQRRNRRVPHTWSILTPQMRLGDPGVGSIMLRRGLGLDALGLSGFP